MFCLSIFVLLCAEAIACQPLDVHLFLGQSNMVGRASSAGLAAEYANDFEDVLFQSREVSWSTGETLSDLPLGSLRVSDTFGTEVVIGRGLAATSETPQAIVKFGAGGSTIGTWRIGGQLPPLAYDYIDDALLEFAKRGYSPRLVAGWWVQGEGQGSEDYYYIWDTRVWDPIRDRYGVPELPVTVAMHQTDLTDRGWYPYSNLNANNVVHNEVMTAAADTDPLLYVTGNLDALDVFDGIHYDQASTLVLGKHMLAAYQSQVVSVPEPSNWFYGLLLFGLSGAFVARAMLMAPRHIELDPEWLDRLSSQEDES